MRELVARLLAKDRGDRPQDARAVTERLARVAGPANVWTESLVRLSTEFVEERSQKAAELAKATAEVARRGELRRQAVGDLKEICEDALVQIQRALPEALLSQDGGSFIIATDDARLVIDVWDALDELEGTGDKMAAAGSIGGENRRGKGHGLLLANVAYEEEDDRLSWKMYRFQAAMYGDSYLYGPVGRPHGFDRRYFLSRQERALMTPFATHVWSVASYGPLTADFFPVLFAEAIALPGLPSDLG